MATAVAEPIVSPRTPRSHAPLTGIERPFADDEIIVSKTDLTGHLLYVNDVFLHVSGYTRAELLGAPHSVIRHPDMPRAIFALLWEELGRGREVFAYVLNRSRDGSHYWVYAHVTPTLDAAGRAIGYHSNRRTVDRRALPAVRQLYAELRSAEEAVERGAGRKRDAIAASTALLTRHLAERGMSYDAYVWSL